MYSKIIQRDCPVYAAWNTPAFVLKVRHIGHRQIRSIGRKCPRTVACNTRLDEIQGKRIRTNSDRFLFLGYSDQSRRANSKAGSAVAFGHRGRWKCQLHNNNLGTYLEEELAVVWWHRETVLGGITLRPSFSWSFALATDFPFFGFPSQITARKSFLLGELLGSRVWSSTFHRLNRRVIAFRHGLS